MSDEEIITAYKEIIKAQGRTIDALNGIIKTQTDTIVMFTAGLI